MSRHLRPNRDNYHIQFPSRKTLRTQKAVTLEMAAVAAPRDKQVLIKRAARRQFHIPEPATKIELIKRAERRRLERPEIANRQAKLPNKFPRKLAVGTTIAATTLIAATTSGATLANWHERAYFPDVAITAGDLGLSRQGDSAFYRLDETGATTIIGGANPTKGDVITGETQLFPGDTIAAVRDATVKLEGANLVGRLRLNFNADPCASGNIFHWNIRAYKAASGVPNSADQILNSDTLKAHGAIAYFDVDGAGQGLTGATVHPITTGQTNVRVLVTATIDSAKRYVGSKTMAAATLRLEQLRRGGGYEGMSDDLSAWAGQSDQINPTRCAVG